MFWHTTPEEAGLSLADWLQRRLPEASAGYLGQLLRSGRIRRNGVSLDRTARIAGGELIELPDSQRLRQLLAAARPCRILRQTEHWLAVDKPAGLPVHRSASHQDNLTDRLQALLRREGAPYRVAPVQRLDLGTSGPVLFGKGRKATGELGKLIMQQGMEKLYLAVVDGHTPAQGLLDDPLVIDGKSKPACSSYRTLRQLSDCSLLLVTIATGRKHQIRRHLAAIGHPVAGDHRYRSRLMAPAGRLFLHQCRIGFFDPWQQVPIRLKAPLPADLRDWLRDLGG